MLVIAHQLLFEPVIAVLHHYFPTHKNQDQSKPSLYVTNKYYQAEIPVDVCGMEEEVGEAHYDMVVWALEAGKHVAGFQQKVDAVIGKCKPESNIILVHQGEGCEDWVHQEDILQCDNLVEVVYDDLHLFAEKLPEWQQQGLLNAEEETGFCSLFDLILTTNWTNMNKLPQPLPSTQKKEAKEQKTQEKQELTEQKPENMQEKEQPQLTQEELQAEMNAFQSLLQQTLSIKNTDLGHKDRQAQAADLLMKLTKNMDI